MKVELLQHMGSDLTVVNAARVSFAKQSKWDGEDGFGDDLLSLHDAKLINYLATHNHWTPFAHTALTFRIKAPIFVARQLAKHQVGLVWNEVSRRYVDDEPEFYTPDGWRKRAENVKQGSSEEEVVTHLGPLGFVTSRITDRYERLTHHAHQLYDEMIEHGVAPEQARMVLPQSMMTEWWWTGSLAAFARVAKLRLDSHTQRETQQIAQGISDEASRLFPVAWAALMEI